MNDVDTILTAIKALQADMTTIKNDQREQGAAIEHQGAAIARLENGQQEQTKQTKLIKRKLNRVAKDVSYVVKTFDEAIVSNRRRIERIEEHVGLPHPE